MRRTHALLRAVVTASLAAALPAGAETRCGWIDNPTPANWWLTDADGEWVIGVQGGFQAAGTDLIPDLTAGEWVATNGSYGYGCICLDATTAAATRTIVEITGARQLPLSDCSADPKLAKR